MKQKVWITTILQINYHKRTFQYRLQELLRFTKYLNFISLLFYNYKSQEEIFGTKKAQFQMQQQKKNIPDMGTYFQKNYHKKMPPNYLNKFSFFGDDADKKIFVLTFDKMKQQVRQLESNMQDVSQKEQQESQNRIQKLNNIFDPKKLSLQVKQSRGIASIMGMAICDALGASTQFKDFNKQGLGLIKHGFCDIHKSLREKKLAKRSGQIGIWTDDASMGLAMAYSLLLNEYAFDPINIRYMFVLWLCHGLGNGGRRYSIGLGGNISISMEEFMYKQTPYAEEGNQYNNGNGSLMRLAPVPVAYSNDLSKAIQMSGMQSLTTHNGIQAQQCAKLMARIIVQLINREDGQNWKETLEKACQDYAQQQRKRQSPSEQVICLALSQSQTEQMFKQKQEKIKAFRGFNKNLQDRDWNWKSQKFTYSTYRNNYQPGYVGSYCMDALAMALHTVWHTETFFQCAIMNADMGGDCDTVGSIAGQIAGAAYGVTNGMLRLYSQMPDFQQARYQAFIVGFKLANKLNIGQSVQQTKEKHQNPIPQPMEIQKD